MCLRGASEVHRSTLAGSDDAGLRIYVVWQPKAGGEREHVAGATIQVPDPRAAHFWDQPGVTLRGYAQVLGLPEDAWDIYMIYGREARWDQPLPPGPEYWMHQLGTRDEPRVTGPYLDASAFAERVRAALAR